jgi:hypothetical protein
MVICYKTIIRQQVVIELKQAHFPVSPESVYTVATPEKRA